MGKEKQTISRDDEYVFRYEIAESHNRKGMQCQSRSDLLRNHLQNILDMVIPCCGDSEVKIDGFKLMNNRGIVHRLYNQNDNDFCTAENEIQEICLTNQGASEKEENRIKSDGIEKDGRPHPFQSIKNAAFYEPTIEFIQRQIGSLLDLVALEKNGKVVDVDGFRLKDLSRWVEESSCDPTDVLGYLADKCNCDCLFCYNKGCPPSIALQSPARSREDGFREVMTRLRYFDPSARRSLFTSLGTCFEAFIHPRFKEVLEEIRKKSDQLIRINTNATTLTEEMVDYLSRFNPLHLDISLQSSSAARRQRLMGDQNPQVAIRSLSLLKDANIVYDIIIVPWLTESLDEMLDDMEDTICYADENQVRLVQISLPGYSRYFSKEELFNHDFHWEMITRRIRDIRTKFETPIIIRPAVYEELLYYDHKNLPEVIGVVQGSPAACSDLKKGDLLTKIGGNAIRNRPQARDLLSILQRSDMDSITLEISRQGRRHELLIDLTRFSYPYSKKVDSHLGIVFLGTGLKTSYLESLQSIIEERKAKNILLLTSVFIKPLLEQIISESPFFRERDTHIMIGVPPNRFFGGNICIGDLLIVQDFIDYLQDYAESVDTRPDLVVIPSSPFNVSGWNRDLTGRVYLDIERKTGVPVEILECQTIYD